MTVRNTAYSVARVGAVCCSHVLRRACWSSPRARAAAAAQKTFATPDDAVSALVQAVKAHDRTAMLAALGNAGEWLSSGDAVADQAAAARFVADYDAEARHRSRRRQGDAHDRQRRLPVRVSAREERRPVALRHRGRQGGDARAAHRRQRARRDQGAAGDRRRAAGIRVGGPQRRRRARVRADDSRAGPASTTACTGPPKAGEPPSPLGVLVGAGGRRGLQAERARLADAVPRLLLPDAEGPGQERRIGAHSTTSCTAA